MDRCTLMTTDADVAAVRRLFGAYRRETTAAAETASVCP